MLKLNRGTNPSGQIKLNVRDVVNANGQFQVTDNDGKGNGVIIVDFKKVPKRLLNKFHTALNKTEDGIGLEKSRVLKKCD